MEYKYRYAFLKHRKVGELVAAKIDGDEIIDMSTPLHCSEVRGDPADFDMEWLDEPLPLAEWAEVQPEQASAGSQAFDELMKLGWRELYDRALELGLGHPDSVGNLSSRELALAIANKGKGNG